MIEKLRFISIRILILLFLINLVSILVARGFILSIVENVIEKLRCHMPNVE
jgi:hypothetical protein